MLFDIPFVADWHKIGDYRQHQTDRSNIRENNKCVDYDYKVGDKVLIRKDGILRKAESIWRKEPWTITTVHTNGMSKSMSRPNIAAPGEAFNTVWYVERIAQTALSINESMSAG